MKKIIFIFTLLFIPVLFLSDSHAALLDANTVTNINDNTEVVRTTAGYDGTVTVGSVVATVIKAFLGLLGVIFVILLIVAGFNWMTAGGDEEKINKAKSTIKAAVIGLIIVVAAYSITYFVFANLPGAGGSYNGGS